MIGRYSLDSRCRGSSRYPAIVGCSNFRYTKLTKTPTHLRDINEKNEQDKATKMYFAVILRAILHKEGIEKAGLKFGPNPPNLIQKSNDLLTKLE